MIQECGLCMIKVNLQLLILLHISTLCASKFITSPDHDPWWPGIFAYLPSPVLLTFVPTDKVCYIYTSGTTGLPKACQVTHTRYVLSPFFSPLPYTSPHPSAGSSSCKRGSTSLPRSPPTTSSTTLFLSTTRMEEYWLWGKCFSGVRPLS